MPCPSRQQLSLLLAERLKAPDAEMVTAHVENCAPCQHILAELSAWVAPAESSKSVVFSLATSFEDSEAATQSTNEPRPEFLQRLRQAAPDGWKTLSPAGESQSATPQDSEAAGTAWPQVADYALVRELGRGGFGVVFLAEQQQPLRRQVALKVLKPGMDTRQVIARFEAERQALALMDHPNIARVLDAGTTDAGRPYFVMELVPGLPITAYCDQNRLTPRERLELFIPICLAVQHAHQKGIIHRDLKPSNVLVTLHDRTPVVKVIDFGIAKATDQQLTDKTLFTSFAQLIGTPLYMSPEQAQLGGLDVDTRSDIYSLGVLLYELLTGTTPFDRERFREIGYDEIRRIIREVEPPRPSTRISTLGQAATMISANRKSDPRRLSQFCRGELDWIVMKALEKDRDRRYETAGALAADVQHYLRHEPVQACPPSALYRLQKFARRRRAPLLIGGLASMALVLAVIGLAIANQRISAEKSQKEQALEQANASLLRAETLVAELSRENFHKALVHLEQGKSAQGMLELARALQIAPDSEADLRHVIRANLAGWRRQLPPALKGLMRGRPPKSLHLYPPPVGDVAVYAACFSPDGRTLATAGDDCVVQLWDVATGQARGEPFQHRAAIRSLAFSPDGQTILAGGLPDEARLWDVSTGKLLVRLAGHQADVGCVAFRPDGKAALTASVDHTLRYWDIASGQPLAEPIQHPDAVWGVAISPDGRLAATACKDRAARLWNLGNSKLTGKPLQHPDEVTAVAFSADGKTILTACKDGAARFWDVATGAQTGRTLRQSGRLIAAALSPDSKIALTCAHDRTACLWDAASGRSLGTLLPADVGDVRVSTFSPDGKSFLTAGMDGIVRLWETPQVRSGEILPHENWVSALAFSPDGKILLTGSACLPFPLGKGSLPSGSGEIQLWDAQTRQPISKPLPQAHMVLSAAFNADGSRFLIGGGAMFGAAGEFQLWDTAGREPLQPPTKLQATVYTVGFAPTGRTFVVGSGQGEASFAKKFLALVGPAGMSDARLESRMDQARGVGEAVIYETDTGRPVRTFPHPRWVTAAAFTPDGKLLLTGGAEGLVRRWNLATGDAVGNPLAVGDSVQGIAVSRDGSTFLTGTGNGVARLWHTATGEFAGKAFAHKGWIRPVAFSPRDPLLASAGSDRAARLWDLATGEPVGPPLEHEDSVTALAFSPDGQWIVTGGSDKSVRFWQAPQVTDATADRLTLWIQLQTGMELTREGELHRLDPQTWQSRRRLLDKLGGPPDTPSSELHMTRLEDSNGTGK